MSLGQPDIDQQPAAAQIVAFIVCLGFLPLLGAQFGTGNQVEQLPIIARLLDPAALEGDFYTDHAARFGPRIYYARALAWLSGLAPLPVVIHVLTWLCAFLLGAVTYLGARRIFGAGGFGAAIAAALAVTNGGFSLGLAGFLRFDSFQPANVAIALALGGLLLVVLGRPWAALLAFVPAALAHPLVGTEIAAFGLLAAILVALARPGEAGRLRSVAPFVSSGLVFLGLMWLCWAWPAEPVDRRLTDAEFFDILVHFRAPHHYLGLDFFRRSWMEAGMFIAAVALLFAWHGRREPGVDPAATVLATACLLVLAACAASLYFTDIAQERLWATAQLFRMLMVVKWAGFLLLGWLVGRVFAEDRLAAICLALALLLATADAHPYAVILALIAVLALWFLAHLPAGVVQLLRPVGLLLTVVLALLVNQRYGIPLQSIRGGLAMAVLLILMLPLRSLGLVLAPVLIVVVLVVTAQHRHTGLFGIASLHADYSWADHTDDAAEIARAAGERSPEGAIWAVPPGLERFRMLSGRGVVISFTAIPFDDHGLAEWRERLEELYGPFTRRGFGALQDMHASHRASTGWFAAARRYGATHAVLFAGTPWEGPVLYENESYKAVPIPPG